jgi:hypothetical protein
MLLVMSGNPFQYEANAPRFRYEHLRFVPAMAGMDLLDA